MNFEAVLFDCDGVLVDSEPITNGVLRDMLAELGWTLTPDECMRFFVGKAVRDEKATIEARTGRPLTEDWLAGFRERRNSALHERLTAIPDVHHAVHQLHAQHSARIACASGADRFKVELQLRKVGLIDYFDGRIFSGHEMPRSKPAPDVYLAAAGHLGAAASRCLVIEDTPTGAAAGVAAGATVWGFCPSGDGEDLRAAGVQRLFSRMADLPELVRLDSG